MFPSQYPSLRDKGHTFWKRMCKKSKINIVSSLSHSHCDCYLLSESSLFVWDHRLLMLTCGVILFNGVFTGAIKRGQAGQY